MKVEDQTEQIEQKAESSDRPTGGSAVPVAPYNPEKTDIGDPMAEEYNKGDLHNHESHITGSGGGPEFRSHHREREPKDVIIQDYIRWTGKSADYQPPPNVAAPKPTRMETLFEPNGNAKNTKGHDARAFNLPETQQERTFPYMIANQGSKMLLDNPLTRFANKGPWHGALAGAGAIGGLGMLGAGAYNLYKGFRGKEEEKLPFWKTVLLSSLAGAGLGAYSGWQRRKHHPMSPPNVRRREDWKRTQDAVGGSNTLPDANAGKLVAASVHPPTKPAKKVPTFQPSEKKTTLPIVPRTEKKAFGINEDASAMVQSLQGSGLPFSLVERITNFLFGLDRADARALRQAVSGLGGAALGVYLAKKLGLGGMLTAGLGLAGGMTGFRMFGGEMPRQQRMTDLYGNPF